MKAVARKLHLTLGSPTTLIAEMRTIIKQSRSISLVSSYRVHSMHTRCVCDNWRTGKNFYINSESVFFQWEDMDLLHTESFPE